ncbi:MAG: glycoside hydrolase family 92 protein, partial [Prevotella sp.]|nr:glycoside hydrolase family 92 protein [Prevotella sp.]
MKRLLSVLFLIFIMETATTQATTYNVAPRAHVTVSSGSATASCLTDGIIRVAGKGEWHSDVKMTFWGEIDFPWVQLDWDEEQELQAVTLYGTVGGSGRCAGGELVFSDGSRVLVREIPAGGAPK